jgi:hypothetical protein
MKMRLAILANRQRDMGKLLGAFFAAFEGKAANWVLSLLLHMFGLIHSVV